MSALQWHEKLPLNMAEVWDVMAKALLLRAGGTVVITAEEMKTAAATPCEIAIDHTAKVFRFRQIGN